MTVPDRDELIATIAHELRGPLALIGGFVGLLASDEEGDGDRARQLGVVLAETRRLQRLVDDLLDLERLEQGAAHLRHEPFDLVAVLRHQVELHAAHSDRHRIELCCDEPGLRAVGDPERIAQVASNLISNALKYSPRGGTVRVQVSGSQDVVTVEVRDPGMGIDPADQARIFDRFYRAAPAADERLEGSGLGLALCRQIVQAHGGSLGVASAPGRGSRFWFSLPRGPASPRPAAGPPVSAARPLG